jgi:hypothetical protein
MQNIEIIVVRENAKGCLVVGIERHRGRAGLARRRVVGSVGTGRRVAVSISAVVAVVLGHVVSDGEPASVHLLFLLLILKVQVSWPLRVGHHRAHGKPGSPVAGRRVDQPGGLGRGRTRRSPVLALGAGSGAGAVHAHDGLQVELKVGKGPGTKRWTIEVGRFT